jgi:NADPH-dependent 2,4-dienoyl-CoA reductase/sulfur reductase-like enzyme
MMGETLNGFEGRTVLKNVQTKSGQRFPIGMAIVAIGAEPNLALVANTPLSYPNGTPVNEYLETDEKGIFAIGDIALYPSKIFGGVRRTEHWESAVTQGRIAGANMSGKKRIKLDYVPQWSSTVLDLHFEFVGDFVKPPTRVEIEGERAKKKFILRFYQAERAHRRRPLQPATGEGRARHEPAPRVAAREEIRRGEIGRGEVGLSGSVTRGITTSRHTAAVARL